MMGPFSQDLSYRRRCEEKTGGKSIGGGWGLVLTVGSDAGGTMAAESQP